MTCSYEVILTQCRPADSWTSASRDKFDREYRAIIATL
jgi:hypothetical protein